MVCGRKRPSPLCLCRLSCPGLAATRDWHGDAPWRRQGLARALIARSLHVLKAQGMTESTLGVDSENLSGATRLYEECGFQVVKQNTIYRKSL